VIARAIAPSGRFQDGDGYCSVDEPRFDKSGGRRKIENDLRTTATTRAKTRAISDLLGTGEVPAEEISGGGEQGPPYGPEVAEAIAKNAGKAAVKLAGGNPQAGIALWKKITAHLGGYMPQAAAIALLAAAESAPGPTAASAAPEPTGNGTAAGHARRERHEAPEKAKNAVADNRGGSDPDEGEPSELEDRALELWGRLVPAEEAISKVKDANGDPRVLRILIQTAERNLANTSRAA
jgi:hypothetical protein